jgi:hypothetical protein
VTNGGSILAGIDGRSATARRYADLIRAIVVDQGGAGQLSEARSSLIRRFAGASVLCEVIEANIASGKKIDITEYATLVSTAVRVAQRIGIDRRAKNILPALADYIEGKAESVE